MSQVLTVRRSGTIEPIPLRLVGEFSVGLHELPIEFELRDIRYGKNVDSSGSNGSSLADRKRDHRKYGIKTAQQCLDQLRREFHLFEFEVISRRRAAASPKSEDWTLLGCSEDTPFNEIRKRYLAKAKELHPDKHGDEAEMKKLTAAYSRIKARCLKSN